MNTRQQTLHSWLKGTCGFKDYEFTSLAGDASFRSYYRLICENKSYIVMDAPPAYENCAPFVAISDALRNIGIKTPEVFKSNLAEGFLLLGDFGDRILLKQLNTTNADILYKKALDVLSVLQGCKQVTTWEIPIFTTTFMRQELESFKEWFLIRYLGFSEQDANALNIFFDWLAEAVSKQPYVFMHRDYHSANLMLLPDEEIGVLDFQDAFYGPVTYDLASLLRDCYIDWPNNWVINAALGYMQCLQQNNILSNISAEQFLYWFDLMSMQRHLKALLTFSRKSIRDSDDKYLAHIPRTLNYLLQTSQNYPESKMLNNYLAEKILCAP